MNHPNDHDFWMARALALARRGEGLTRPNPPVGAVVVRKGIVVGQGWHQAAGRPHAEVLALQAAGPKAKGAVLYVTLEPCCTFGRTPPCTAAILRSGIRRVVVGASDPNPQHCGRGIRLLRRQGIETIEDVLGEQARELIAPFAKWITTGRPYLTLKLGLSADGKIADIRRRSRWITGPAARREVQALRRACDAILVGAGTVLADDPSLLPKPAKRQRPFRVILDGRGRIPANAHVLTDPERARTIMATTNRCPLRRRMEWLARGAQVWILPAKGGGVSLPALIRRLGKIGVLHVLCEGGGEVAEAMIRARQVDAYQLYLAPCILGGKTAVGAVGGVGWRLPGAPRLVFTGCRLLGKDVVIKAKPIY
jgi:diaminohydroxyphosphoribosylaminopyrimidine deaminase/5-amino-6-(5-phosphoribosylamino)uracil reductase